MTNFEVQFEPNCLTGFCISNMINFAGISTKNCTGSHLNNRSYELVSIL